MHAPRLAFIVFLLSTCVASSAIAGVADSPLPNLDGRRSKRVFTVPGVLQNTDLATTFICTSLEKTKDLLFFVEIFAAAGGGRENGLGSFNLSPGATAAMTIGGTSYTESAITVPDSSLPRSARIVATSTKLACTAAVLGGRTTDCFRA